MADTPTPRSYQQTLGEMFDAFLSNQGIKSLRVGGPIVSMLEAAAQSDTRNSQDIFNLLTSNDLDNAEGLALARKGADEQVPKLEITPANGLVTISDKSFTKIATKVFQGSPAPIIGSVTIPVVDADAFPSSGSIYIGRGTNSYEGPLAYTSKSNVGNHWTLTLSSGTSKFHNTSESVILAQGGNRAVGPNTIVRTPQANTSTAIEFRTLFQVTVPDGETKVVNVGVVCQKSGIIGNIIAGAIKEFASTPFTGATVTNPRPFTNGRETESDDDYRERIRAVKASRQLGTRLAIETSVTGITAFDENKRINSAKLVKRFGFPSTLYIDDGTGYEEKTAAIAIESLMDDAVGGETHFETTQRPIAKAFVATTNEAPYILRPSDQLSVKVGGVTYTHSFNEVDFHSISNASAFEVVASINSNPDITFSARTVEQGTKVAIFALADVNEDVEVVQSVAGTDANDGLAFPAGVNYTMRLYKNDRLLVKDGVVAQLASLPFASWDSVAGPTQDLSLAIDNTPAISFSFVDQDFIDANTGYATIGRNSLAAWAAVINAKVPGITATVNVGRLVLTSNAGPVAKAAVEVTGGSLVTAHFFPIDRAEGQPRDYTLDRNEAQVVLSQILETGDRLTAGSFATRAFIESDDLAAVTTLFDSNLWWVVDGDARIIQHGVTPSTTLTVAIEKTEDYGNVLTIAASSAVFANVHPQDWMILWDSAAPASLRGVHRVADAASDTIFLERHTSLTSRAGHRSVLIPGAGALVGKILTCGGGIRPRTAIAVASPPAGILSSAELYDHNTKTTTPAAPMNVPRAFHTATVLANGKVVVVGGMSDSNVHLNSIEIYDSVANSWTLSVRTLTTARKNHTATLLTDGRILIAGGDAGTIGLDVYQIYDPAGDTITVEAHMVKHRSRHCAVKLPDDTVLIAGGFDNTLTTIADAELFTPGPDTTAATGSMIGARSGFGMETVTNAPTKVIAVGNHFGAGSERDTWELYTIGAGTWGSHTSAGNLRYEDKPVVKLTNGHVVGLDGFNSAVASDQRGFTYDGTTFTTITSQPPSEADMGGPRWDTQLVELKSGDGVTVKNIVADIGGNFQHGTSFLFQSSSVLNLYVEPTDVWNVPDPATPPGPLVLADAGIAFVRSDAFVQDAVVPFGANYTASSLADTLNDVLVGATASVYKTTKLRVNTNTFDATGDIALVTEDAQATALLLTAGAAVKNIVPHLGAVMSASSDLGTPSFEDVRVVSQESGTPHSKLVVTSAIIEQDYALTGLRNWNRGGDGSSPFGSGLPWTVNRANSNFKFDTRIKTVLADTALLSTVDTRNSPVQPWGPWDRVYAAAPFAISPNGNLDVIVDDNNDKRYPINLFRNLTTVGTTYSQTNTFRDGDAGGVSLADALSFGLDYDFNDMAVYMSSRAVAFSGDAARRIIFRYFRLGPDGDGVRVRFGNPDAPNQPLTVVTNLNAGKTDVTAKLRSGAPRAVTVHNTTRVGRAVTNVTGGGTAKLVEVLNLAISTASRTTNVTTATLTLPTGILDHGIAVGSNVWVASTDVNFSSGLKTVTAVALTTIQYTETAADQGATANIGTVSFDSQGEATYTGASVVAGDYFRMNDPTGLVAIGNLTFQVTNVPAGGHYIEVLSGDQLDGSTTSPTTVLVWVPVQTANLFQVFANSPQTAGSVATAIAALRDAAGSTCPIEALELGTGVNNISQNSCDENDNSKFWYTLNDGVNWVKTTTSPGLPSGDYTLEFKKPITGALSTNSDWANEEVRIVPITTKNVVDWLNTPTVTGLWTQADIEEASEGHHVQISTLTGGSTGGVEVQGGLANAVTAPVVGTPIPITNFSGNTIGLFDGTGFHTNMWCRIENENALPKTSILGAGTVLNSWDADGLLTFAAPILVTQVAPTQLRMQFEKQGRFIAIADTGATTFPFLGGITNGAWLRISPAGTPTAGVNQVAAANQGLFRVLRFAQSVGGNAGTIYIENPSGIEENSECTFTVYDPDSPMPGDELVVLDNTWGPNNIGIWTVKAIGETTAGSGDVFTQNDRFTVDVDARTPVPHGVAAALATDGVIYLKEGRPCVYVMRVHGMTLNQTDGNFLDITWDKPVNAGSISSSAGSIIQVLDKLEFPLGLASGADGYRYDTGLLREANKVIYGDPSDSTTYPGVAAADSHINIQGSLVKRIQVAVSVRVKTGLNTQDIANRVRSAVATVVNQTAVGESISFSDIIDAARDVTGVVSVAIVAPLFSVGNDQIRVQPYEKPYVLDLTEDVQVSFLGI